MNAGWLDRTSRAIAVATLFVVAGGQVSAVDPKLEGFDIAPLVRFATAGEAEARRAEMVKLIWPEGLPTTRPKVSESIEECPELASVDQGLMRSVDRYDIDVAGMDFHSLVYVAHPRKAAEPARLAIVHAGHMPEGAEHYLSSGLSDSINHLLEEGFYVAVVQMPLAGWNKDADGMLPSGKTFDVGRRLTGGHDDLFAAVEPELEGQTLRFFLEPVVVATNELVARHPDRVALLMIGLSGGGWTTHVSAAVDPRIDVSIPVAGALPLYARPFSRGSKGDAEQEYAPLYREEDTNGDGVLDKATGAASWLEIFALGGISPDPRKPRHQVQVLNRYDSCCFGGDVYQTYAEPLTKRVADLRRGSWRVMVDESHRGHSISEHVIDTVLAPVIEGISQAD